MDSSRYDGADLVEPPLNIETVAVVALIGTGLCGFAALLGGVDRPDETPVVGIRVILTIIGMIVAGAAITQNGTWFGAWLLGALTCLVAGVGFPESWDSFRLVAHVFAGLSAAGGVLLLVPIYPRMLIIGGLVMVHFTFIMSAVTNPHPAPWLGQQVWSRYARPYLYFAYLNNAYQFYSPDPGPATELWFLVEYEFEADQAICGVAGALGQSAFDLGQGKRWFKMPKRPEQVKDPFAMTYFRRLSLTEYASHIRYSPLPAYVQAHLEQRRMATDIPLNRLTGVPGYSEPADEVRRSIIPSYIRHVAFEYEKPDLKATIKGVKLYRVQHRIISMAQYVGSVPDEYTPYKFFSDNEPPPGKSVYDPSYYLPYYMGEYDTEGRLMDRTDRLVYWLVSIFPKYYFDANEEPPPAGASMRKLSSEDYRKFYRDYVIQHSGSDHR